MTIKLHFLDVGDGDCTIVEFPSGRIAIIDIHTNHNNTDVINYIKNIMGNEKEIFRFILTHPHQDHLHGLKELEKAGISITNFWHTEHSFEPDKTSDQWEDYEEHWNEYDNYRKSEQIKYFEQGKQPKYLDEDGIYILSPSSELNRQAKEDLKDDNDNSIHRNNYVIKIKYGKFSAILSGDSDLPCWNHLKEEISGELSASLWKVPHHGTDNYYDEELTNTVNPTIMILSAGKVYNETSAFEKYKKKSKFTFNTERHGNTVITANSDGKMTYSCESNSEDFL